MDEQAKTQEAGRRTQEAARRTAERGREAQETAARMAGQLVSAGTETLAVFADVNQQVLRDLVQLSSAGLQEGTRLWTEMQHVGVEAVRNVQSAVFRMQTMWPEALRDPLRWYQRTLEESIDVATQTLGLARKSAETATQSYQRLQSSAEESTRSLQEVFRSGTSKLQEVYERSERLRAA